MGVFVGVVPAEEVEDAVDEEGGDFLLGGEVVFGGLVGCAVVGDDYVAKVGGTVGGGEEGGVGVFVFHAEGDYVGVVVVTEVLLVEGADFFVGGDDYA